MFQDGGVFLVQDGQTQCFSRRARAACLGSSSPLEAAANALRAGAQLFVWGVLPGNLVLHRAARIRVAGDGVIQGRLVLAQSHDVSVSGLTVGRGIEIDCSLGVSMVAVQGLITMARGFSEVEVTLQGRSQAARIAMREGAEGKVTMCGAGQLHLTSGSSGVVRSRAAGRLQE